ncbi:MAG TPA: ABC transporter substrate-binding protein [Myxococcales bacterium]|jgi:branched-chain amino acid transport system substrate-binding protein|nr:ABC transporter substrate-binding protein [Myxococcales bacterium]
MFRILVVAAAGLLAAPTVLAEDSIKIAIVGPMAFAQGENQWAGAEMARDEINKEGGISVGAKKRKIEIVRVDSNEIQSVPDATNAMERAVTREKADFVIGGFRSEAVLAMQEVAMDNKKIFLGCGAADAKLGANVEKDYERYKYWFRVAPLNSPGLGKTLFAVLGSIAGQIRTDLKKDTPKVAILAEKVMWTEAIVKAAQANLPKMKMEVVGLWQPSPNATDVTAELAAIDRAGADMVFTALSGPVGVVVGRQMGERKMRAVAFGINVEAQKDGFWEATAGKGNYVATLDTYAEVEMTPKMIPFVKAFKERYHKTPTYNAGTYDAIHLLKIVIEQAGTIDANKLVPLLEKTKYVGTGADLEFDKMHDPIWGLGKDTGIAVQWQNGKKVPFWPTEVKGMKKFGLPGES